MQQMRFRLDSRANFLTKREALERLTHYLNFTGKPQEADCPVRQDWGVSNTEAASVHNGQRQGPHPDCQEPLHR